MTQSNPILQLETSETTLRQQARELSIEEIQSNEVQLLIREMKEIMRNAPGVGLAAPQIGLSIQLAVIEDPEERLNQLPKEILKDRSRTPIPFHVIINPKIIRLDGKINYFFEGCLSIQNRVRITPRYDLVEVKYLDENGSPKTITAHGWYARILQHEIDHLNGKLYVDLADPKTDMEVNDEFKRQWANALSDEILQYANKTASKHEKKQ